MNELGVIGLVEVC